MSDTIKKLALDAIAHCLDLDHFWHEQEGSGEYQISGEIAELIRRARNEGLVVQPLYEGFEKYLDQIDADIKTQER